MPVPTPHRGMPRRIHWRELALFIYAWQLTGCVHVVGHALAANFLGIRSRVAIPWQRFVPLFGWSWNLYQPHAVMMCHYDDAALDVASPVVRVLIGFAGPYVQLIFVVGMGTLALPSVSALCGGAAPFAVVMFAWQLLYFVWYAMHFHQDPFSDFALFVRRGEW